MWGSSHSTEEEEKRVSCHQSWPHSVERQRAAARTIHGAKPHPGRKKTRPRMEKRGGRRVAHMAVRSGAVLGATSAGGRRGDIGHAGDAATGEEPVGTSGDDVARGVAVGLAGDGEAKP